MRRGFGHGFRIRFDRRHPLHPAQGNFRSVVDNPTTVSRYIAEEVATGRLELVPPSSAAIVHWNPIGLIPKPHQPNRFRLIVDFSAPQGFSINDDISSALCSLEYVSVDKAVELIARCGRGALMTKTDLLSAYRQVPIHKANSALLGLEWEGRTYTVH